MKLNDLKAAPKKFFCQKPSSVNHVKIYMVVMRRYVYGNHVARYNNAVIENEETSFHSSSDSARDFAESKRKQGLYFTVHGLPAIAISAPDQCLIVSQINISPDKILRGYIPDADTFQSGTISEISESFATWSGRWNEIVASKDRVIKLTCDRSVILDELDASCQLYTFVSSVSSNGGSLCWSTKPENFYAASTFKLYNEIRHFIGQDGSKLDEREGEIYWFNHSKGYGFIRASDQKDIFFHISSVKASKSKVRKGKNVSFDVRETDRGLKAVNIELVDSHLSC